ncbi:MAG: transposase [Verrucomicrobia bacterium]|nr:transposase [Verrucomicrobiota bacterium]
MSHEREFVSDAQWEKIATQLRRTSKTGRPRADDWQPLNAILRVLTTGCRWNGLPREYGHYSTAWRRLRAWATDGTLLRLWRHLLGSLHAAGKLDCGAAARSMARM